MKRNLPILLIAVSLLGSTLFASADVSLDVRSDEVRALIELDGLYVIQMTISFEQVVGLNAQALEITAQVIDPLDSGFLSRLPNTQSLSVPAAFPIMISVNPSPQSGLSFTGLATIDLATTDLHFDPSFRLFKAPNGGAFADVTVFSGMGSYRVRGTSGEFSDFLIMADLRPASEAATTKFAALQADLDTYAQEIDPAVLTSLNGKLDSARQNFQQGLKSAAIADLEDFSQEVEANQGSAIPDLYRANDPTTVNVAGALRSRAATLIFSIKLS